VSSFIPRDVMPRIAMCQVRLRDRRPNSPWPPSVATGAPPVGIARQFAPVQASVATVQELIIVVCKTRPDTWPRQAWRQREERTMTIQFSLRDTGGTRPQNDSANLAMVLSPDGDLGSSYRSPPASRHLAIIVQAAASVAGMCLKRLLAALHESRRKQAAIERARYRHLIYDPTTGIYFGTNRRR